MYDLDKGKGYIDGFFPKCYLKHRRSFVVIYDAIEKGLREDNPWSLYRLIELHSQELGLQMAKKLKTNTLLCITCSCIIVDMSRMW